MNFRVTAPLLVALLLATATPALPCSVARLTKGIDIPREMVRNAEVILRVTAVGYGVAPQGNMRTTGIAPSTVRFRVEETLKGTYTSIELQLDGYLSDRDDYNDAPSPYTFVRVEGRRGSCFANTYRADAQFLLMLKNNTSPGGVMSGTTPLTVNWYALGPVNEQLLSEKDPWLVWVRDEVSKKELPRIAGVVQVDEGTFPPAGSLFGVPLSDPNFAFKVTVTPEEPKAGTTPVAMALDIGLIVRMPAPQADSPQVVPLNRTGAFTFALENGSYRVRAERIPFGYGVKSITSGSVDITQSLLKVSDSANPELRIVLTKAPGAAPAGVRVQGRITGMNPEVDLNRIWVTMSSEGGSAPRSGATQPTRDGGFEFSDVPPGRYTVKVVPAGGNPPGLISTVQAETKIDVGDGENRVAIPLFGGVEVKGRMVDRNGKAVGSNPAFVLFAPLNPPAGATPPRQYEVRALPDGTFTIWLPTGEYTVTVAAYNGLGAARPTARSAMSGTMDLLKTPLKLDGTTPIESIVVTIE